MSYSECICSILTKSSFHPLLVDTPSAPGGRGHVGLKSINEIRILQVLITCFTACVGVWECQWLYIVKVAGACCYS